MCDTTRRSSDDVRRTCARPTTTIAAAITTTTVATSVAAAALPPANSTAPIAAALTTPTLPAAIPTPSLAASIAAASEPAAIAAATEHEAPEHEPPERRPEERTYTLGDVQRALRISVARPKLTGRAKPGIRSWRGRSSRAAAAGARCRSRAHVAGWRGRWQCTATRHSLPAARAAAARRTRCWLRVRRRLPPAARPPHVDEDDEIKEVVGAMSSASWGRARASRWLFSQGAFFCLCTPRYLYSYSRSVISRSRPALTPLPSLRRVSPSPASAAPDGVAFRSV